MHTKEIYKEIFWAQNSGFTTGRDPLGIQSSSIATYTRLLPGMTNLTLRLRYYGFYCWLLSEYIKMQEKEQEKSLRYHWNFIRRGELTLSFIMVNLHAEEKSVIGSDFTKGRLPGSRGYWSITGGADKTDSTQKGSVYWDYSSGALGQYYAGALMSLGLIEVNKFFILQQPGKILAAAFLENVGVEKARAFLQVIKDGKLYPDQIKKLNSFSIAHIPYGTKEWNIYHQLLLGNDGPTMKNQKGEIPFHRRKTIENFLRYRTAAVKGSQSFASWMAKQNSTIHSDTVLGWAYYHYSEQLHYIIESIFFAQLIYLGNRSLYITTFLSDLKKEILASGTLNSLVGSKKFLESVSGKANHEFKIQELEKLVYDEEDPIKIIACSITGLISTYQQIQTLMPQFSSFENDNFLDGRPGAISTIIRDFLISAQELNAGNYVDHILIKILNDHIATAYRKMGNGESSLLKVLLDDNYITRIETMWPKNTSPRLNALNNFMIDLGLLVDESGITVRGQKTISEIEKM